MNCFKYEMDTDDVLTVTMDDPEMPVNVMNDKFTDSLTGLAERIEAEREAITGVIITSAKKTFSAGGDLTEIIAVTPDNVEQYYNKVLRIKAALTRIERAGVPVVAAINGAALGGGYEICLASHHRIAIGNGRILIGLPEVTLGLLPGGGGVVRLVRLIGLEKTWPIVSEGAAVTAEKAVDLGLVDDLADDSEQLLDKAKKWILANSDARQPWDEPDYSYPGGCVGDRNIDQFVVATTAKLQAKKKGLYPAPQAILSAAVEGMQVDFEAANRIEARYLAYLATTNVAKNMITTFFQLNKIKSGASRPQGFDKTAVTKLGILGAGMMGAGIAHAASSVGLPVVLKDVSLEAAQRGKSYTEKVASTAITRGLLNAGQKQSMLDLILATDKVEDLAGCDLVVEAVFEDRQLKSNVTKETEVHLADEAIFASNTSSLPITGLAEASRNQENFIGLHFFSPVDRMPLVEIIVGKNTSDKTLAKAYDFVRQIKKIPIVVNDSRDFYTSRVYESYCDEGAWLLSDGVAPALIENLAQQTGMPAGPLASVDAVSQKLVHSVKSMAKNDFADNGWDFPAGDEPPYQWVDKMVNQYERSGKAFGAGYYEYPKNGKKYLWPELSKIQTNSNTEIGHQDIKDRILFRQCIEAVRCLEEKVLRSVADCNIGSIKGIGFPPYTGGQLQYINDYGVAKFTERAAELAGLFGERFDPPAMLESMADAGQEFE